MLVIATWLSLLQYFPIVVLSASLIAPLPIWLIYKRLIRRESHKRLVIQDRAVTLTFAALFYFGTIGYVYPVIPPPSISSNRRSLFDETLEIGLLIIYGPAKTAYRFIPAYRYYFSNTAEEMI